MTSGHFIYIPAILTVGLVLGFILGGRAARDAFDMEKKRDEERKKIKAEREARRAAKKDGEGPTA
jgi:Na+/glutamate symporter